MGTIIKPCDCKHEQQDKMYGSGKRVWNHAPSEGERNYRCTVCLTERKFFV